MAGVERKVALWAGALSLGLLAWLYWDVNSMAISYRWHFWLIDPNTGDKIKPSELLQLGKVLNKTESYISNTNAIERLYDLEYNLNVENPFPRDEIYSSCEQLQQSAWPVANQSLCTNQLDWIFEKLAANKDYALLKGRLGYELSQLMDNFGRPEAGSLTGAPLWMGSYEQCLKTSVNGTAIRMRYCWVRMRFKWWPVKEQVFPNTRIKVGICIPETCDTSSFELEKSKLETLTKHELPEFYKQNLVLDSMFCLPDERSPIRQLPTESRVFLWLCGGWLSLVIIASIIYSIEKTRRSVKIEDLEIVQLKNLQIAQAVESRRESRLLQVVGMLAIQRQLQDFLTNRSGQEKRRVDLGTIDFAKSIMSILIVLGHSFYLSWGLARSRSKRIDLMMSDSALLAMGVGRLNDVFFLYFGVLSSYVLLKKYSENQLASPKIWLVNNWQKLIRVGPLFMLVFWYTKLISIYTSHGPWWDYAVFEDSTRGFCLNEPWWKSIPYFGLVGVPPISPCVFPGWFLVVYVKLSLLMPLLTFLLYKLPTHFKRHLLIVYALFVASLQLILKISNQTSYKSEALTLYGSLILDLAEKFESTGMMATLGKLGPVTLGCYVGYLLRMYEIGDIQRWPKWLVSKSMLSLTFLMQATIIYLPILGRRLGQPSGHVASTAEFLAGYTVSTCLWSISFGLQLIALATVYNRTPPVRFICHHFWHVFNKLSFAMFLIHWEVLWYSLLGYEQAPTQGHLGDIFKTWATGVFYTVPLAFVVHISFEMPTAKVLQFATSQLTSQSK